MQCSHQALALLGTAGARESDRSKERHAENVKLRIRSQSTGGGFFHSKGTWGCAAHKGILFRTSSLAKGILFGNFSRV